MEFVGHKTTKIPTLLGLSLLITALILGIFLYFYQQNISNKHRTLYNPTEILITNVLADQVTITWWTETPTLGQVAYGTNNQLTEIANDNRDNKESRNRQVHFVTLRNLKPETNYYYQVLANGVKYPENALSFKTANFLENSTPNKPLRGSVLNTNLNPIDEALVTLHIDGASEMTTFTSTAGNFIIPLKELRTSDLSAPFLIEKNTPALIIIKKGSLQSQVELNLPIGESTLLPPLTIGQNINLKGVLPELDSQQNSNSSNPYDLNSDGKINSLDLAIITQNDGKQVANDSTSEMKKSDLNKDGFIDKKDSDLLLTTL